MNRQEVLHGLNNAVTLFKQQEALSQEYERVQQKDRPYEEKRKIGWLGIIILGFEIYYGGMMIFVSLFNIVNNVEEHVETSILLLLMCIAGIITTYLFFRMRTKSFFSFVLLPCPVLNTCTLRNVSILLIQHHLA